MDGVALTQLIPIAELAPGAVGAIRNEVINSLLEQVSRELSLPKSKLVVRDLRPVEDLTLYSTATTATTINDWIFTTAASTVTGYVNIASTTMADQRYVAIFGVRDLRNVYDGKSLVAVATVAYGRSLAQVVSLIKITVGGADKAIWDITKLQAYPNQAVGISPGAVIIPQNASYAIAFYKANGISGAIANVMLEGVVVEPRGKVTSP